MKETYTTIFEDYEDVLVEKKSRFIANIFHVENEQEAKDKLNEIKKKHYDAKHHVYAYRLFNNGNVIEKFSDDGEPAQTAGKPIIELLKQKDIYNTIIIVTRYFGGILLGTGGLTRAYTASANLCLENTNKVQMVYSKVISFSAKYDEVDKIKYYLQVAKIEIEKTEYMDNILFEINVKETEYEKTINEIENMLSRKVDFNIVSEKYVKK